MDKVLGVLERYVPPGTAVPLTRLMYEYHIHLHIKRDRRSKAGDYRCPVPGDMKHRISINHNLNPYAFLITFVHELAHRKVWEAEHDLSKPHGASWKKAFRELMQPFLNTQVFPAELLPVLLKYFKNPGASSSTDTEMVRALRQYDRGRQKEILLEDLPEGALFGLGDERIFKKGPLRRKRYICDCITNHRKYLVSGIAAVFPEEVK